MHINACASLSLSSVSRLRKGQRARVVEGPVVEEPHGALGEILGEDAVGEHADHPLQLEGGPEVHGELHGREDAAGGVHLRAEEALVGASSQL